MEYGSAAAANLEREFREETGLEVRTGRWMFATELIQPPLHAVEFFFEVTIIGGVLRTGFDPEMGPSTPSRDLRDQTSGRRPGQLIEEVRFMSFTEVDALPPVARHGAFQLIPGAKNIGTLNGYHRI
jgi:8-oxo-dGTP diphosphatase